MKTTNKPVLFISVLSAFAFVGFGVSEAAKNNDWPFAVGVILLGISVLVAVGLVIFAEWGRPDDCKTWTDDRIRRSYERNVGYARQWLNVGLGFAAATALALVPWLWNLESATDDLSPWRLTLIGISFLLLSLASGSFLMYGKYRQFYQEDDRSLDLSGSGGPERVLEREQGATMLQQEDIAAAMPDEARNLLRLATSAGNPQESKIRMGFKDGTYEFSAGGKVIRAGQNSDHAKHLMAGWGYLFVWGIIERVGSQTFGVTNPLGQQVAHLIEQKN